MKKIIAAIIIIIVCLGLLELVLNLSHYNTEILYQYQPEYGWSHMTDKNFWYKGNLISINKDGFRDINHQKEKPPNTIRLAFIGQHYLRGSNSPTHKMATNILEQSWNSKYGNKKIEVFNFTCSKYSLPMVYFVIKKFAQEYQIDYFFYTFYTEFDPSTVSQNLKRFDYSPILFINEQNQTEERLTFSKAPFTSQPYETLNVYQLVRTLYNKNFSTQELGETLDQTEKFAAYPEVYFDKTKFATSSQESIEKMSQMIDYIIDNNKTQVYILVLPSQYQRIFQIYEEYGHLDNLKTPALIQHLKDKHELSYDQFLSAIMPNIRKVEGRHFDTNNLVTKLKKMMNNSDRLIYLEGLLNFVNQSDSNGFLFNWHRHDAGQAYIAKILEDEIKKIINQTL